MAHVQNLVDLPRKKIELGLRRLQEAGITPERWSLMLGTDRDRRGEIASHWPKGPTAYSRRRTGFLYGRDATLRTLLLGDPWVHDLPQPTSVEEHELVVYYGGWSLADLRRSAPGKNLMWPYYPERGGDPHSECPPGYYRVKPCFHFLDMEGKKGQRDSTGNVETRLLEAILGPRDQLNPPSPIKAPWQPAPTVVTATALLVHNAHVGNTFLGRGMCECAERMQDGRRTYLSLYRGRIDIKGSLSEKGSLWLAAAQLLTSRE